MLRIWDVKVLFQVSKPTIYKWMQEGLPHFYVGKLLFFKKEQIEKWARSHDKILK